MANTRLYRGFRYPRETISHVVWLYFRFSLSFRDIEELMVSRGVIVTYETIRQWTLRFGQQFANELRRRQPRRGDKWHLDEVVLTIKGKHHYLWRAVDQDGHVLDVLVQSKRNRQAAKRFFCKLLKGLRYVPRVLITDRLKSYAAAKVQIMPGVEHRQHKGLNNRAELSHQPTRQRERQIFVLPEVEGVAVDKSGALGDRERQWDGALCEQILASGLSLEEMENMVFREAVARCKGNLSGAARLLGMTRPQLSYRLKRCMIDASDAAEDHAQV